MQFDPTIKLGSTLVLIGMVGGGIGGWFTLKQVVSGMAEKIDGLKSRADTDAAKHITQHDENVRRFAALELQMERECVKKDDFTRFEDRVNSKFEKIEHTVKNSATITIQAVKEAVRDMLPRGDR